jgi:MORN repeat protein
MRPVQHAAIVGVLLAGAAAASAQLAGGWIPDTSAGCKVWNPHPQPGESVHWVGMCANGFAHGPGAAQWFRNSLPFEADEGEWRAGRQAGYGSQVWPSGRYDGELVDGEPHGRGVMIVQGARYEGDFRNGKPNGAGTFTNGKGSIQGMWTDGCFRDGARKASFGVPLSSCP